jgi:hypothetical protein
MVISQILKLPYTNDSYILIDPIIQLLGYYYKRWHDASGSSYYNIKINQCLNSAKGGLRILRIGIILVEGSVIRKLEK